MAKLFERTVRVLEHAQEADQARERREADQARERRARALAALERHGYAVRSEPSEVETEPLRADFADPELREQSASVIGNDLVIALQSGLPLERGKPVILRVRAPRKYTGQPMRRVKIDPLLRRTVATADGTYTIPSFLLRRVIAGGADGGRPVDIFSAANGDAPSLSSKLEAFDLPGDYRVNVTELAFELEREGDEAEPFQGIVTLSP